MQKLFIAFLVLSVIDYAYSQCGCRPQKLLKRDAKSLRIGDMILDQTDIALLKGFKAHYPQTKRWPNGQVYYSFAPNFPRDQMTKVRESLSELQRDLRGCIRFEESRRSHFIEVLSSPQRGCYSLLGYGQGPSQPLNLENPGCLYSKGTIKHEFIHALGFMHTQMRKDRDQHISINWPRIMTAYCSEFQICHGCELDGPYETNSVMHYPSYGFACYQGENVVLKRNGGYIDYNHNTTPNDIDMIRRFYQC